MPNPCKSLSANEADAKLRAALDALARAEGSAVLMFAEIFHRRLYRELGYPSIQHYARDRLGFSPQRTSIYLDLARRLEALPRLRAALVAGEIGWTKARLIARAATAATERQWLDLAARTGRRELAAAIARGRERTRAGAGAAAVGAAGPAAAPAVGASAETAAVAPAPAAPAPSLSPSPELPLPLPAGSLDPPPAAATVAVRLDPEDYARFGALIESLRKTRRLPRGWGQGKVIVAGLEALLEKLAEEERRPAEAASAGAELAEPAPMAECRPSAGGSFRRRNLEPRYQIVVHRDPGTGRGHVVGPDGKERPLSRAAMERIECDARVVDEQGRERSAIPPRLRRRVLGRDGHRCRVCGATRYLEIHHLRPRARGGGNALENLVTLCSDCHQALHERPEVGLPLRPEPRPALSGAPQTG